MGTTFSQLIDSMVNETKRFDLAVEIATYLNQTIRELHFRADTNAILLYPANYNELQLTVDSDSSFGWTIPSPATFQKLESVQYPDVYDCVIGRQGVWPDLIVPNRTSSQLHHYYYQVGNQFIFSGYGGINNRVNLGYYAYPARLVYYPVANRPAQYDDLNGWTYGTGIDTDEEKAAAEAAVSNWLLLRWDSVIEEGLRAKVYKRVSDDVRSKTCYSLYQSLRQGLWTAEAL